MYLLSNYIQSTIIIGLVLTAVTGLISSKILVLALSVYADDQTGMKNVAQVNNSTITNSTPQVRDNVVAEKRQVPSVGGKLTPNTISSGNNSNGQILTTQMVAKQLATMDSDKIANYPLKDLSPTDLVTVFSSISPAVLEKTLSSISDSDLATILNKISIDKRQQILDRLSPDKKQEVLDRLSGQLFK
jgi:hypothetical protein